MPSVRRAKPPPPEMVSQTALRNGISSFLGRHGLTLALLAAVGLAVVWPEGGRRGGWLASEWSTDAAVFVIFLLLGLSLPTRDLGQGVWLPRFHLFTQGWIFLGLPILAIGFAIPGKFFFPGQGPLWDGLLFLGVLPTTVASAITFTAAGRGDVPASVLATTISNLSGVLLTPLWVMFLFSLQDVPLPPAGSVLSKLGVMILLPMLIGQFLRPAWLRLPGSSHVQKHFRRISSSLIVFIVFCAFAESVHQRAWEGLPFLSVLLGLAATLGLLLLASRLIWLSSGWWGIAPAQRTAAFFCSSQKTLAAGVPMANILFVHLTGETGGFNFGLLLLPLLFYHPLQLILAGILVPVLQDKNLEDKEKP